MRRIFAYLIAAMLLASCAAMKPPQDGKRGAGWYTVKISDTLYSIAWRYGLDYEELASWNGIDASEPIYPGQRLRLLKPLGHSTPATSTGATVAKAESKPKTSAAKPPVSKPTPGLADPKKWLWPTRGKPLNRFNAASLDRRGIRIAGKAGQPVIAVADGRVVYSGNGLAGYGNLIIIKHSETYLSAYAYCQQRLVEEGMSVKAGRQVATMGARENVAQLHFEIRRNGKPVDPIKYLPRQ